MSFRTYHDINLDFYLFSVFFRYILFSFLGSFSCIFFKTQLVGLGGLEPPTSRLSGVRSNHLSYKPICLSFYEPTALLLVLCGTHIHQYVPFLETRVPCIFAKILRIFHACFFKNS